MALVPSKLVDGPIKTQLVPTAFTTNGAGAALQSVPKRTTRTVRVEVNSVDRDYSHYPYSSEFRWLFPFPVKEVREVRLVGGTIPVPFLNIDERWNKFTFQEGFNKFTGIIPPGFYTIITLCKILQQVLDALDLQNKYAVVQSGRNSQIKIVTDGILPFGLLFATGEFVDTMDSKTKSILDIKSPARILGFGVADYFSKKGVLQASRLPNLWYTMERSYLYLSFDSSQDLRSVFRGGGRKEPSAIIYNDELNTYNFQTLDDPCTSPIPLTKYLNKETFDCVIIPAPAPISRISAIDVSLRDMFYNPIDLQGRELTLLLELVIVD